MKNIIQLAIFIFCLLLIQPICAADYNKDLSIEPNGVNTVADILVGETVRVYATVTNNSDHDLFGVVKFYDENKKSFAGEDQPVSVLAQKTDDVFIDWKGDSAGNHTISVRVIPWNEEGDDPSNNKVTKVIYVDIDSDGDGIGDRNDPDIDGDGVPNHSDAFPYDPNELEDTDKDGIGNNADEDDDGDGVPDYEDAFPLDPAETLDTDGDNAGDNADAFPYDPNEWKDTDNDGIGDNSDSDNMNHGPVPQIETEKTTVRKGNIITFNALNSRDPDGEIVDYKWNFGDGAEKTGVVIDYIFKTTGDYNVTLKVTDDKGETREQIINIKVLPKWQTIALITVTLLLVLLIIGRLLITSGGKKPKIPDAGKTVIKKKKALPKKKK